MRRKLGMTLAIVALLFSAAPAFAQATSAINGVVVDTAGGIVPGATVVIKNVATGVTNETVSNSEGTFSVPALSAGTYSVTVSLQGFKTAVINDIRLVTGNPQNIKATLEVGALTETITVTGGSELVQTQSTAVTSTLQTEQLQKLPMSSRNSLYAASFLPGVETAAGPRQSTFSGLPQNTINVTLDGVTTGNLLQSGDGFFSMVTPRLDAVEEVTVTGATPGAAGGAGNGAVQVAFVTRSGSNRYDGSIYHYFRDPDLATNTFFNEINGLDKNKIIVHQYGARSGGPIVIPGLFNGRDKAFYFLNFEHLYQPTSATRTRTILNPDAAKGIFTWTVGGQNRTVDLLALAAANGQTATADPLIQKLIGMINEATTTTGTVTTPQGATNHQSYVYQAEAKGNQYAPTGRLDYNITNNHKLSGTYYWQRFTGTADLLNNAEPSFPGFPNVGIQQSYRTTGSVTLRSTLSDNKVNELKGGWQWSPNNFFGNVTKDMYDYQEGWQIAFPNVSAALTSPSTTANHNSPAPRNTWNFSIDDSLNWLRGNHSLNIGAGFARVHHLQSAGSLVPVIGLGVDQTFDPANGMFTTANFPGASTTNLTQARNLYALITGRVNAIQATARLNAATGQYDYLGTLSQRHQVDAFSLFAQDSWRMTPTFTLNYGLRYEVQMPMEGVTTTWSRSDITSLCGVSGTGSTLGCNVLQAGNLAGAGVVPQYFSLEPGEAMYDTDWNNLGPSVGFAWRPNVQNGFLRTILGDPDQATLRGSYGLTYGFERLDRFFNLINGNPGGSIAATRDYTTGYPLVLPGESAPVLLRQTARLGPPAFPSAPAYPLTAIASNSINVFDPNIETPMVHSYSAGFQRSLGRDTAIEIRYVGNRSNGLWLTENLNEDYVVENGFLDEFQKAQANLRANIAAGNGATFAYTGAAGTQPLPIYLAYFLGKNASLASQPSQYTGTLWTNSAWTGHLGMLEPDPIDAINDLHNNTTFRANAITAGLPANFAQTNPAVTNANILTSSGSTYYNSVQFELRRRLANGFLFGANYTYARKWENNTGASRLTLARDRVYLEGSDVPHSFKMNWFYELPFGRGRKFGANMNRFMDLVLGGWDFSGTGRVQAVTYQADGLRLVGMTKDELQKVFKIRHAVDPVTGVTTVFSLPQDIIDNTRKAFNTDPTSANHYGGDGVPTGRYIAPASTLDCLALYLGDCGSIDRLTLNGPLFTRFDMTVKKRITITNRVNAEFGIDIYNVFNNINYNHQFNPGGGTTVFQVTTQYTDVNTTFDPGGRLAQLSWRINW